MRIADERSLQDLIRRCRRVSLRGGERIEFALPLLPGERCGELERRANRLWRDCGCGVGGGSAIAAILAWVLVTLGTPAGSDLGWAATVLIGFLLAMTGAGIGKVVGVLRARRKLAGELEALALELQLSARD